MISLSVSVAVARIESVEVHVRDMVANGQLKPTSR